MSALTNGVDLSLKKSIERFNGTGICISICWDNKGDCSPTNDAETYRIYNAVMYEDRNEFNGMLKKKILFREIKIQILLLIICIIAPTVFIFSMLARLC